MTTTLIRGNALALPLAAGSVDLIVTSPPYFGLRSYTDGGEHYPGQIGSEPTPAEFLDALIAATTEMVRVLKPGGSIFVNLGDKYARNGGGGAGSSDGKTGRNKGGRPPTTVPDGIPEKSLMGLPWRYAIRCIDELGLILRAEVIWSKPNGLPESVTDRVRRSHEQWFHFTREPRYFSAVDVIREPHAEHTLRYYGPGTNAQQRPANVAGNIINGTNNQLTSVGGLGKLPGSVWSVPTQPLTVPAELGVDHFAAFPMEWPRRIILGWSPSGICTMCGEGRRPVASTSLDVLGEWTRGKSSSMRDSVRAGENGDGRAAGDHVVRGRSRATITGEQCACPTPDAPTRPAVVLDPFGGTGTVAMVADALGRHGISVDMSGDYCRLAKWRTNDPGERAKAAQVEKPPAQPTDMDALW